MERQRTAQRLVQLLLEKGLGISTAESCTGGMVAAALVDVPGASQVYEEGYITYSDRVKERVLGVRKETLQKHTAVSAETAREMAEGAARISGAQMAISVTGYAGPEPAEDGTPAGTVYIGVWYRGECQAMECHFQGGRQQVRRQAAQQALALAAERLEKSA